MDNIIKNISTDDIKKFKTNIKNIKLTLENIKIIGYIIFTKIIFYNYDNSATLLSIFCKCCFDSKIDLYEFYCFYNNFNSIVKERSSSSKRNKYNKKTKRIARCFRNFLYYYDVSTRLIDSSNLKDSDKDNIDLFIEKLESYDIAFFTGS